MCEVCNASKTNKIVVNKTEVLDLTTGIVTDAEGNTYPAPMLTEEFVEMISTEGVCEAENFANKDIESAN